MFFSTLSPLSPSFHPLANVDAHKSCLAESAKTWIPKNTLKEKNEQADPPYAVVQVLYKKVW